ncbi:GNAT family N-acetyltransferase [Burkholderia sp. Ac-20384]|uniref:GNAT family N-acetyltransferase n=1 Tax=Burkholderia sp. Ac-20384 TaxID=2703902 RepID=UPI00197DEA37|nr:GNAT family N-acetyltransferase [Burkholderia sp. Ac-20384]MBN3825855.1 GNAT family N-acetyltransferase [Burkholderia sp. Ac-20384]
MDISVEALTPDRWPDIEALLSEGAVTRRCWCTYWRIGPRYRQQEPSANKSDLKRVVAAGPPPGILAYVEDQPVGWCQVGSRELLPYMEHAWRLRSPDNLAVWTISCFYIRKDFRRRGISSRLINAAIDLAKRSGAHAIEAYPIDRSTSPSSSSTGFVTTFERFGFLHMPSPSRERPIMRLYLNGA